MTTRAQLGIVLDAAAYCAEAKLMEVQLLMEEKDYAGVAAMTGQIIKAEPGHWRGPHPARAGENSIAFVTEMGQLLAKPTGDKLVQCKGAPLCMRRAKSVFLTCQAFQAVRLKPEYPC